MQINWNNFKSLYKQLLENNVKNYKEDIYPFVVQIGNQYFNAPYKLLFVGKSTNGWLTANRNVEDLFGLKHNDCIIQFEGFEWVEKGTREYNPRRSAFWRLIKRITMDYLNSADNENWYNFIAWSNLYKLGPLKGNPNKELQELQRETCIKILHEEIKQLKPDAIIFLTSNMEEFFIDDLGLDLPETKIEWGKSYKTYYQKYNGINIIRTQHPQAKKETPHVDAILEILRTK